MNDPGGKGSATIKSRKLRDALCKVRIITVVGSRSLNITTWIRFLSIFPGSIIGHSKNEITEPVIMEFPSWKGKRNEPADRPGSLEETHPSLLRVEINFGAFWQRRSIMGAPMTGSRNYQEAGGNGGKLRGGILGPNVYERYVVDYRTTALRDEFVTEITLPIRIFRGIKQNLPHREKWKELSTYRKTSFRDKSRENPSACTPVLRHIAREK